MFITVIGAHLSVNGYHDLRLHLQMLLAVRVSAGKKKSGACSPNLLPALIQCPTHSATMKSVVLLLLCTLAVALAADTLSEDSALETRIEVAGILKASRKYAT